MPVSTTDLTARIRASLDAEPDRINAAVEALSTAARLLASLVGPDPCWFDHNGGCQAHGFLDLKPGERCPNCEAQEFLSAFGVEVES